MNKLRKFVSLLLVAALCLTLLPMAAMAAGRHYVNGYTGNIKVVGTSTTLPEGNYTVEVKVGLSLVVTPVSGGSDITIANKLTANDKPTQNGITYSSADGNWAAGMKSSFSVEAEGGDTTVISGNNIKLLEVNRNRIRKGDTPTMTFEITDYNVNAAEATGASPKITAHGSDSFVVASESKVENATGTSGKYTLKATIKAKYLGKGNTLAFTIGYSTDAGQFRTIDCTAKVPYTEEYVEDKDDDEDDKVLDPLTPYIIVDSYSYGGDSVTAGEDFTLKLRLRNTSETHSLENIVMNVAPQGVFSMTSSSNTFFIEKLHAGSVMEREVTLKAGLTKVTDDDDANSINMKFEFQYIDADKTLLKSGTSSESITLPVFFPDRFEVGIPEYESQAMLGDEVYISVPIVNKSRSSVYNISAFVRGDVANPGQNQFVGNLNAGTENSTEFTVRFDSPGDKKGEIVISYEDANMNPKEQVVAFSVLVEKPMEPEFPDFPMEPEEPAEPADTEPKSDPTKAPKILIGLLAGGFTAYLTIQKAKAKRSIFNDEDL